MPRNPGLSDATLLALSFAPLRLKLLVRPEVPALRIVSVFRNAGELSVGVPDRQLMIRITKMRFLCGDATRV